MKKCPFCRESIQDEAIKCKHCGEFLNKRKNYLNCLWGCLIVLVAFFILGNIFIYLAFSLFKEAIFKASLMGMSLPHLYLPLNAQDMQVMFRDLGEGIRIFWENVTGCPLSNYQRIYL
jgi:predicted nucleic acid-binding Zn ribbon protein